MSLRSRGGARLRRWLLNGVRARQLSTFLVVLAAAGLLATGALQVAGLAGTGLPLGDGSVLILGAPAIAIGQLWALLWGTIWRPVPAGAGRVAAAVRAAFGPLPVGAAAALGAVAVGGVALALRWLARVGSGEGRELFAAAVMLGFFAVDLGVALGARRTQRAAAAG